MMKVYHNPRCRKSNTAIKAFVAAGIQFEEVRYLEAGISKDEAQNIFELLNDEDKREIIRRNEDDFKSNYKGVKKQEYTAEIISTMLASYPRLLQRPLVVTEHSALIARSDEIISEIINKTKK